MENELGNIGQNAISIVEDISKWFFSLSTTEMIGVLVVLIILIIFLSIICKIIHLFFYRWYVKGIIHNRKQGEKE